MAMNATRMRTASTASAASAAKRARGQRRALEVLSGSDEREGSDELDSEQDVDVYMDEFVEVISAGKIGKIVEICLDDGSDKTYKICFDGAGGGDPGDSKGTVYQRMDLAKIEGEKYWESAAPFEENLYDFVCMALIRDLVFLTTSRKGSWVRFARCSSTMILLYSNIGLQIFLLFHVKWYISASAVHGIRDMYSTYQEHMYDPEHTYTTVNGFVRGVPGHFEPGNFADLDEELQEQVCNIPLSVPYFLTSILLIWAMTCIGEVQHAFRLLDHLIIQMPTVKKAKDFILDSHEVMWTVVGLSKTLKAVICVAVIIPQLGIASILLWLGSRWLTATVDFTDLLLNAVALEFIFGLKDLLYRTVVSPRSKLDMSHTEIDTSGVKEVANLSNLLSRFVWVPIAVCWVAGYIFYLQQVLPNYNWDVHEVCVDWLREHDAV